MLRTPFASAAGSSTIPMSSSLSMVSAIGGVSVQEHPLYGAWLRVR